MSEMDTAALRSAIESACSAVRTSIQAHLQKHQEQLQKAREAGDPPPERDNLPSATSSYWMRWACDEMREHKLPSWIRDEDVQSALDEDLVGPVMARLLELQEFAHLDGIPFEIGWSPKAALRKDVICCDHKVGKVKAVSKKRRLLWPREAGEVPDFELELSLPFFLLATEQEIERGLHELLAPCAYKLENNEPTLKKPDISSYSSTLGRYGVSTPREAQAVAHVLARPHVRHELAVFGYGPDGQGILFSPREGEDNLLALGDRVREGAKALEKLGIKVNASTGQLTPQTEA